MLDFRYACRQLRKSPVFTATAVATIALGIAATTTAFAIARGVLWSPLPFDDPGRLYVVWETDQRHGYTNRNEVSFGDFLEWRDSDAGFETLTALACRSLNSPAAAIPNGWKWRRRRSISSTCSASTPCSAGRSRVTKNSRPRHRRLSSATDSGSAASAAIRTSSAAPSF